VSYQSRERRRLTEYARNRWQVECHILPYQLASETLHESVRETALAYFNKRRLSSSNSWRRLTGSMSGRIGLVSSLYDRIGGSYRATRRPDPRIAAAIVDALGDARTVVNVGAGTGAYEPTDRKVLAVEPSETMLAQRPRAAAPAIQASAEELPLADDSFDAALAVNSVQHWADLRAGLRELRRVARRRVVVFLRDPRSGGPFWLVEDYVPALDPSARMSAIAETIEDDLRPTLKVPIPLPRDCVDGLFSAFWGRPGTYLDADVRRNISNFALADENGIADGLARLRVDLESGAWDRRYGYLRSLPELDLGHRLLIAELEP
jgi:SAM-dependent methyltransferase